MRLPVALAAMIFWASALPAAGQEGADSDRRLEPSFELSTSVLMGSGFEYVFDPASDRYYNDPISRLTWPVPPSVSLGLSVVWPWTTWTATHVTLGGSVPVSLGTVVDEDWRADTLIYSRSAHAGYVPNNWKFEVEQSFTSGDLSAGMGFQYRMTEWEAWNGSREYTATTFSGTQSDTFSGLVLGYRQQWLVPYFSGGWTWSLDGWSLTPRVRASPFTWCFDRDDHLMAGKRLTYLDNTVGWFYGRGELEAAWEVSAFQWGVRVAAEATLGTYGSTITTQPSFGDLAFPEDLNAAGAWFYEASLTFFVRN